jgi:hypothetical protein
MRSNRVFWALMLVLFGFVLLASNLGFINVNVWRFFWPVLLIALGVWFLIGTTMGPQEMDALEGSVDLEDAKSASVTVKHGAGRLSLSGIAEPGKLVSGQFVLGLDARVTRSGEHIDAILQPQRASFPDVFFPGNWIGGKGLQWDFGFNNEIPLDLRFEIGAVEAFLDLTDLIVKDLVVSTGASSSTIKLPAQAGLTHLKLEAGAASLDIHVPEGVAARIEADIGLASLSVNQDRFPKQNGYYQSADYESAENKVDIRIESGVSSIDIH